VHNAFPYGLIPKPFLDRDYFPQCGLAAMQALYSLAEGVGVLQHYCASFF
jgi:hypothetical protein